LFAIIATNHTSRAILKHAVELHKHHAIGRVVGARHQRFELLFTALSDKLCYEHWR
jgi:predicted transcriptional regulator